MGFWSWLLGKPKAKDVPMKVLRYAASLDDPLIRKGKAQETATMTAETIARGGKVTYHEEGGISYTD